MEDTRERILQSALQMFAERGFTGATTREIATRALVTEVTLFRHFPSKAKLLEEVICSCLPGPDFRNFVAEAKKLEYRSALEAIAHFFLDGLRQHESLIRILYIESQQHHELMEQVYIGLLHNLEVTMTEYFQECQENGVIREFNPKTGAKMFLGIWSSLFEDELLFGMNKSDALLDRDVFEFIDIFVRGTQNGEGSVDSMEERRM